MTLNDLPELMTVAEVQAYLRIGKNAAYGLITSGQLASVNLGRRQLRVPRQALAALLGLSGAESKPTDGAEVAV